jgi:hypothetical protein
MTSKELIDEIKDEKSSKSKLAKRDLEYPELQLVVCKKGYLMSDLKKGQEVEKVIFLDGGFGNVPVISLRIGSEEKPLTAGEYYIFYRPDFKNDRAIHPESIRKITLVFYSEFYEKKT